MSQDTEQMHEKQPDLDTLMGRIVDSEASRDDLAQFESMAATDAGLWRTLALRQVDMAALSDQVREQTDVADGVTPPFRMLHLPAHWALTLSGWAAVLAIAGLWWASGPARSWVGGPASVQGARQTDGPMTPDQHLQVYLEAPFVVGELDMVMTSIEPGEDGLNRIHFVRRIEEWVDIQGPTQSALDQRSRLLLDPARHREMVARRKPQTD